MNIYESMNAVMEDCGFIGKDSKNLQQGYKFRGIDAVLNALNPAFRKNKVFVVPTVLEQTREERTTAKGGLLIYSVVTCKYTFYAEDGSSVSATVIGEGMDSGDKATNKAMSAAFKYACFQAFCIPTEEMKDSEDDDPQPAPKAVTRPQEGAEPTQANENTTAIENAPIGPERAKALRLQLEGKNVNILQLCKNYKVRSLSELTEAQMGRIVRAMRKS